MMPFRTLDCPVITNRPMAADTFELTVSVPSDISALPGQFANVAVREKYLRRPLGICGLSDGRLTLLYKVIGGGTTQLSGVQPQEKLNIMLPLGNGFDLEASKNKRTVLVGGGLGLVPLYPLAKALAGRDVTVVLGFTRTQDAFYIDEFRAVCPNVHVATVDGGLGKKGFPTTLALSLEPEYYYACGPTAMMDAMRTCGVAGQLSLEARMGCGFGACMGCTIVTRSGPKRICVEGPVFDADELIGEGGR